MTTLTDSRLHIIDLQMFLQFNVLLLVDILHFKETGVARLFRAINKRAAVEIAGSWFRVRRWWVSSWLIWYKPDCSRKPLTTSPDTSPTQLPVKNLRAQMFYIFSYPLNRYTFLRFARALLHFKNLFQMLLANKKIFIKLLILAFT